MYHWIEDKEFLKKMRRTCSDLINQLVQYINNDDYLTVEAHLVGSGAKNLETQNGNEPIDLDYNLNIIDIDGDINDCHYIKEYVRKTFNVILERNDLDDCNDSTSALSTSLIHFLKGNQTDFSIDLAIVCTGKNQSWHRLIHKKTGVVDNDQWYWNEAPHSKDLDKKVKKIKEHCLWNYVRDTYLNKKNMYLKRNDHNHPSFNCYIEAVNEVYYDYFN